MSTAPALQLNPPQTIQGVSVTNLFPELFKIDQKSMKPEDVANRSLALVMPAFNPANGKPLFDEDGKVVTVSRAFNFAMLCEVFPNIDSHFAAVMQDIPALLIIGLIEALIANGVAVIEQKKDEFNKSDAAKTKAINDAIAALTKQLSAAQGDLSAQQLNLATWNAKPDSDPDKVATVAADNVAIAASNSLIADLQQQIQGVPAQASGPVFNAVIAAANAKDALTAAQQLVWVTQLDQWKKIAPALGVTDVNQLPMALHAKMTATDGTVSFVSLARPEGI